MKRTLWTVVVGMVLGMLLTLGAMVVMTPRQLPGLMVREAVSPHDVPATLARIEAKAKGMGWQVPKTYDFREAILKKGGEDVGPVHVMEMCQPQYAARMLGADQNKRLAVLMPCAIAVYQKSDGQTYVASMNMELMSLAFGGEVGDVLGQVARDDHRILDFLAR